MRLHRDISPIKSAFPKEESFTYDNVPRYFKSVTDRSLHKVKNYCARVIRRKYHNEYQPNALTAMIQTIDGEFEQAYAMLEADYNTRRTNLQSAYQEGLADIEQKMNDFRQQVNEHDEAFYDYNEIHQGLVGRELDKKLLFSGERFDQIEQNYNNLQGAKNA